MGVKFTIEELWNALSTDEHLAFVRRLHSTATWAVSVKFMEVKDPWIWFELINIKGEITPALVTIRDFQEWLQRGTVGGI
jgi:hypothetical protein